MRGGATGEAKEIRRRSTPEVRLPRVTIDLGRLRAISESERDVLEPYLSTIQAMRRTVADPIITIRAEDLRVISGLVGLTREDMSLRLDELGLNPARPGTNHHDLVEQANAVRAENLIRPPTRMFSRVAQWAISATTSEADRSASLQTESRARC